MVSSSSGISRYLEKCSEVSPAPAHDEVESVIKDRLMNMLTPRPKMTSPRPYARPKPFCPSVVAPLVMAVLPLTVYLSFPLNLIDSLMHSTFILAIYLWLRIAQIFKWSRSKLDPSSIENEQVEKGDGATERSLMVLGYRAMAQWRASAW
jgi:small-conductance mechanosensitive channel